MINVSGGIKKMTADAQVCFKSLPVHYNKEKNGLKSNTVRRFNTFTPLEDIREIILLQFIEGKIKDLEIVIENTETQEAFKRIVLDVTYFSGIYIISWG